MGQYVLTNGTQTQWIMRRKNKYVTTTCYAFADVFSKKQAEGILNCNLSNPMKAVFHMEKIDEKPKFVKQITDKDLKNTAKLSDSKEINEWIEKISTLNGLIKDARNRKDALLGNLSEVDRKITDIQHYIEFSKLNAAQGYKAYKMEREWLLKRRKIKNEIAVVSKIVECNMSDSLLDDVKNMIKTMDNRTYNPRFLDELYDL